MGLGGRAVRKPPSSVTPKSSRQSSAVRRPLSVRKIRPGPDRASVPPDRATARRLDELTSSIRLDEPRAQRIIAHVGAEVARQAWARRPRLPVLFVIGFADRGGRMDLRNGQGSQNVDVRGDFVGLRFGVGPTTVTSEKPGCLSDGRAFPCSALKLFH